MTRHDARVALILVALVVAVGLAIGVIAGLLTRGDPIDYTTPEGSHGRFSAPSETVPQFIRVGPVVFWRRKFFRRGHQRELVTRSGDLFRAPGIAA